MRLFQHFERVTNIYKNMDKITQILEIVVRCKYFEAGVHIKDPMKNSYQDGLGGKTPNIRPCCCGPYIFWDKRRSQINEYSDFTICVEFILCFHDMNDETTSTPCITNVKVSVVTSAALHIQFAAVLCGIILGTKHNNILTSLYNNSI